MRSIILMSAVVGVLVPRPALGSVASSHLTVSLTVTASCTVSITTPTTGGSPAGDSVKVNCTLPVPWTAEHADETLSSGYDFEKLQLVNWPAKDARASDDRPSSGVKRLIIITF